MVLGANNEPSFPLILQHRYIALFFILLSSRLFHFSTSMESTQSPHHKASQSALSLQHDSASGREPASKQKPVSTATPLLGLRDATFIPQGWPTAPSRIKHPLSMILVHWAFDIALFTFSACFLTFAIAVIHYDHAPTSENPTATSVLTKATKYVRSSSCIVKCWAKMEIGTYCVPAPFCCRGRASNSRDTSLAIRKGRTD